MCQVPYLRIAFLSKFPMNSSQHPCFQLVSPSKRDKVCRSSTHRVFIPVFDACMTSKRPTNLEKNVKRFHGNSSEGDLAVFFATNFCFRQDNKSSISSKDHVGGCLSNEELPQQRSLIVPYLDTVAASSVDVSFRINLDTVWNARVCIREYAAVGECLCNWVDIETVSVNRVR